MARRQAEFKRDTQRLETDYGGKHEGGETGQIHYIYNGSLCVMI